MIHTTNLTDKNIRDFTDKDTIYVQHRESKHQKIYYCKFVSFNKGLVTVRTIDCLTYGKHSTGYTLTVRLKNCLLWGLPTNSDLGINWEYFNRFNKQGFIE